MNILHLTYRDSSGVPSRWAQAHRDAGRQVALLVEFDHPFQYRGATTVLRWTPGTRSAKDRARKIEPLLRWADAVMAYDHPFYLDAAIASRKPVMFRALGQSAKDHADEIRRLLRAPNVVRATAGLAEIALLLDIDLVGAPFPLLDRAQPSGEPVLCHAPAERDAKRTDLVLEAAEATGWQVELVEGVSHEEALARKSRCALVVDGGPGAQPDGYGVNSIEAMAVGLPAVSYASAPVRDRYREAGSPVLLAETSAGLRDVLRVLHDASVRAKLGDAGREFVARFHSAEARAAEDLHALSGVAVAA